jgi:SpoVK/Ycf46/Vps4 family AAA+-type ATPase
MAFTRRALKDIGVTDEQLDKIMALHGTSLADYQLKSEFDDAVKTEVDKQIGEQKKQFEGIDLETLKTQAAQVEKLQSEISNMKLGYTIENRLMKERAVNPKAVSALLDMSKIATDEKGEITGLDEQITALKETEKWAFEQPVAPGAGGLRQSGSIPIPNADQQYLNEKYGKNPYFKSKT